MSRALSVALSLAIFSFVATLRASCFPLDVFRKAASTARRITTATTNVTTVCVMLPSHGSHPPTVRWYFVSLNSEAHTPQYGPSYPSPQSWYAELPPVQLEVE